MDPRDVADAWLQAGVRILQLRAKRLASGAFLEMADQIAERSRGSGATFIVNDRADIARLAGAAGVHVGQEDLSPEDARRVVGSGAVVGVSTHSLDQLRSAIAAKPDYVAIGPVFDTATKEAPDETVGLPVVRAAAEAAAQAGVPLVAIGGITLGRVKDVLDAGAAAVALIADLMTDDPAGRVREFLQLVSPRVQ